MSVGVFVRLGHFVIGDFPFFFFGFVILAQLGVLFFSPIGICILEHFISFHIVNEKFIIKNNNNLFSPDSCSVSTTLFYIILISILFSN